MFNKSIGEEITLGGSLANDLFSNIIHCNEKIDNTFIATLRALLGSRMKDGDLLHFDFGYFRRNIPLEYNHGDGAAIIDSWIADAGRDVLYIRSLNSDDTSIEATFKLIDKEFLKEASGYRELEDLKVFVSKQTEARFFINEEKKSTIIFVSKIDTRIWHFIQSFISRYIPWYFDNNPLDEAEKELVKSLVEKTSTNYVSLIEEFAKKFDFRKKRIEKLLNNFERSAKESELKRVSNEINSIRSRISNYRNEYRELCKSLEEMRIRECGIQYILKESLFGNELVDYFVCNSNVDPLSASDGVMEIMVKTTLELYDPDLYERMTDNPSSYLFTGYTVGSEVFTQKSDRKRFLDSIFSDEPMFKVKISGYYVLDSRGYVDSQSGYYIPDQYQDYIPNPHLYKHNCIGNNIPLIEDCLRDGNFIGAVEQCITSAKNINLAEGSQTLVHFLRMLFSGDQSKVILMHDGKSCTPEEAYEYLIKNEEVV